MNSELRVHTDSDGIVWCGQHGVPVRCTGMDPKQFVSNSVFRTASIIRAVGVPQNSPLLLSMYERHRSSAPMATRKIHIGSPCMFPVRSLLDDPEEVLLRLWQQDSHARLAAMWHTMGPVEFNSHMLCATVRANKGVDEHARLIFRYHPIYEALSFFSGLNLDLLIRWVCDVCDPRWFIDADHPNRLSKLMRFSGLTPENFKEFATSLDDKIWDNATRDLSAAPDDLLGRHWKKAFMLYGSWATLEPNISSPSAFVWRIFKQHNGSSVGMLKASQSFLRFIVLHWLQELSASKRSLFDPLLFFKTDEEIGAYIKHSAKG